MGSSSPPVSAPATAPARRVSRASPPGPRWLRATPLDTWGRAVTGNPSHGGRPARCPHRPTIAPGFPAAPGGSRAPAALPRGTPGRRPSCSSPHSPSPRAAAIPTRLGGASGAGRRSARAGSCPDDLGTSQASDAARRVAASACSPACPAPSPSPASRLVHARPRPLAGHPSRWPRPPARPEVPVAERWTGPERIAGSG